MKLFKGKKVILEAPEEKKIKKDDSNKFGSKTFDEINKLISSTKSMLFLSDSENEKKFYKEILDDLENLQNDLTKIQKKIITQTYKIERTLI